MMYRTLLASSVFALVASFASSLVGCAPVDAPSPDGGAVIAPRTLVSDDSPASEAPASDVYVGPGALVVRWSFAGESASLAESGAAHGVAALRIEVGLDGPVTVPCAAAGHRYEELPAGMYSVTVEPLDASGAPVGEDLYGVTAVRSGEESNFEAQL